MTPEERAEKCLEQPLRPDGGFDWSRNDSAVIPVDLEKRIADAIRAAVAEERETFAHLLFAVDTLLIEDATPHRGEIRYAQAISPQIDRVRKEYEALRARG